MKKKDKKQVVLPTDFSKNAWNAIVYALTLFKDVPCDFFLLNAFQVGTSGLSTRMGQANDTRLFHLLKEQSERDLEKVLQQVKEMDGNPEHTFETLSIADNLVNAIGRTVYNKGMDYIIMGTKGATGLKEVFMGSNTYKIIKEIDFCPIIAVPEDFKSEGDIDTILLATGYEHLFEAYELRPLLQIAKLHGSKISITLVGNLEELTPEQEASRNIIKKQLRSVPYDFVAVEKDTSIYHTIQKTVEGNGDIQMVAMINRDRGFFERLTREPVVQKVSFNSKVPFLVIHLFE
ncbi:MULTISPECIES: universal stress protein [Flagellimonas]|uniref:Universal stress protein n=1 Tax=Flagellimonas hadalis TaxID=2597517 RepID=A0A5N5ILP8_9FLAO|nr:universal stress protein [Allomuricauda hadalis]KAB5484781.1 universal stress protein [Allomuricauda hadalis]RUA11814.1 MAG: hypothetical protein DSY83_16105 [Flavobacteriia bacterium]